MTGMRSSNALCMLRPCALHSRDNKKITSLLVLGRGSEGVSRHPYWQHSRWAVHSLLRSAHAQGQKIAGRDALP